MTKRLKVSDHAIVRYLDRTGQIDMIALRREISDLARSGFEQGATAVLIGGLRYPIRNGVITTVHPTNRTETHIGSFRRKPERDA